MSDLTRDRLVALKRLSGDIASLQFRIFTDFDTDPDERPFRTSLEGLQTKLRHAEEDCDLIIRRLEEGG